MGCCGPLTPIIHPDNELLIRWIVIGIIFVIYEIFMTPYRLCFDAPALGPVFYFEAFINIYFICDVCLNFFISFRNHQGEVVSSHTEIMKTYLKGWFS